MPIYLFIQLLWYVMSFAHTSPVSFRNMSLTWILSLLKFATFNNLSATSEVTWPQMMHGLSLKSGDVIVLDFFGLVSSNVIDERSGSSGIRFGVSTSCLASFFLHVKYQDLMWCLISTNPFWSMFVTKQSSSFPLVLIIVSPGSLLVSLDEPALPLTFWQIKSSSNFKGFGLGTSCTVLDCPGIFSDIFVLVWLSRRRSYTFINTLNTPQQIYLCIQFVIFDACKVPWNFLKILLLYRLVWLNATLDALKTRPLRQIRKITV